MDAIDSTVLNELQTLLQSANPDLVKSAWSRTTGDVMSVVKVLKQLQEDDKEPQTMFVDNQNNEHGIHIPDSIGTALTEFGNLDEIQDPDLKFALQLQHEELEREQKLKKQQEEDSLFALKLQQEGDVLQNNLVSANFQLDQTIKISNTSFKSLQKENEPSNVTIDDDDKTCVVCLDIDRNAVFAPCAHRICCAKCAHQVFQSKRFCPLCWTDLEGVIECQNIAHKCTS